MAKEKKPQPTKPHAAKSAEAASKGSRTEQRQIERLSEQRRQRYMTIAITVGVLVLLGVILLIVGNTPADAPIPEDAQARYEGLTQVVNERGYPRTGSLDGISVAVFNSIGCDTCDAFHNDILPQLVARTRTGDISLTYIPLRASSVTNFNGAARSALCAAQQGAFFPYVDALVSWVEAFGNGAFADNRLTTGAANLGLEMNLFHECRRSAPEGRVFEQGMIDLGDSRDLLVLPPAIFVNNIAVTDAEGALTWDIVTINQKIDEAIAFRGSSVTPEPTAEATPEPTAEATVEPTIEPTEEATAAPTVEPTAEPASTGTPEGGD